MRPASKGSPQPDIEAFSLVEIVVAVGVVGFAMVAVVGLFAALARLAAANAEDQKVAAVFGACCALIDSRPYSSVVPGMLLAPGERGAAAQTIFLSADLRAVGFEAEVPEERRYYAVTLERNDDVSGDFVYYAPLSIKIEWPWSAIGPASSEGAANVRRHNYLLLRR